MKATPTLLAITWIALLASAAAPDAAVSITIDPAHVLKPVSRQLTGVCIEDVNHEIYGGLYSQMIFGESFAEPCTRPVEGFAAYGGSWSTRDGIVDGAAGDGGKLVRDGEPARPEKFGVDVWLPAGNDGNAGLIFNVARAGVGADRFDGYEVSLDAGAKIVRLGRHRHDYRLIRDVPCDIGPDRWISISVARSGRNVEIFVDGKSAIRCDADDIGERGLIGLRTWRRPARFRNLWTGGGDQKDAIPLAAGSGVSGMWAVVRRGGAVGSAGLETSKPFVGAQCQRITLARGTGDFGIENRGLNRQGLGLVVGGPYRGHLWARAQTPVQASVALASGDGAKVHARSELEIADPDWHRYDFTLTPDSADSAGRFEICLVSPGSVEIGFVFLEPGPWGTFKGLPVRRDVVQGLIDEGVTAVRYGGSMVNSDQYRWKKMTGDRDHRPPYRGLWYPYSSNGWGIADFLNLCDAAGFMPVPDFNLDESPADMVDFLEYANGPADSPWGAKRAADGHPTPYRLSHIELGNEERVDEKYFKKFEAVARAIWAKDPEMVLTVGDFTYEKAIDDPMNFTGADSGITNLSAHKKILDLAREFDAEVWFDIHVWTEKPPAAGRVDPFMTYVDAIDKIANGAKHHVVIFELNANNHAQRRALANAQAVLRIENDGRVPFVSSANGLQVDRQNDNGWDQGLVFMDPAKVWLQPPGYVEQMLSRNYQPTLVGCAVDGDGEPLNVAATASDDRKTVVLQVVNGGAAAAGAKISVAGFASADSTATVQTLAAALSAANSAGHPDEVRPTVESTVAEDHLFPPHSVTVIRWQKP